MGFFVKFWGTRGSIPTPGYLTRKYGGNTTCVEIRIDDTLIICDAGTGIRELGVDLMKRKQDAVKAHLFFSHMHFDHIQGFPFFTPCFLPSSELLIYGRTNDDTRHYDLVSGQMESDDYFPVNFKDLGAHIVTAELGNDDLITTGHTFSGIKVRSFAQMHPGGSLSYSFEKDGYKVVFSTDNEIDLIIENSDEVADDVNALRKIPQDFLDFCHGADLLICDGQYTDKEYPTKIGWGHPRATTCVDLALQAEVKQLAITHHDPMQTDDDVDDKIGACRVRAHPHRPEMVVFAAREGLELKIT
ncbi:MAG: MBL fold metallo-hydrolase [Deltaproteobacteria bacterium]|nr:MBL fold metallo-hydrolase [Deltaproteobacteria bacterium]